jgi:hypothetical protein
MFTHLALTDCPICRRPAEPLAVGISYGLPCFKERVKIDYRCCPSCGFVFQGNPLSRPDLATYYSASPRYRDAESSVVENQLHHAQLKFMTAEGPLQGRALLDIGADMGKFLDRAKELHGAATFYMEDSERGCAHINAHGRHRQIPSLQDEHRFDWIVLSQVLEHIVDPVSFLRLVRLDLAGDGRVFIEIPCQSFWDAKECHFSFEHVNYFSPATLASALQAAGFITTKMEVGTDQRYSQGNARIIRAVAQVSPVADLPPAKAAEAHYQRSMASRFEKIRALTAQHREKGKVGFYGAAELADLLLANTDLDRTALTAIFDTAAGRHGTTFHGLPVRSPKEIPAINPAVIVILSAAEVAIRETIRQTGFTGRVIGWSEL